MVHGAGCTIWPVSLQWCIHILYLQWVYGWELAQTSEQRQSELPRNNKQLLDKVKQIMICKWQTSQKSMICCYEFLVGLLSSRVNYSHLLNDSLISKIRPITKKIIVYYEFIEHMARSIQARRLKYFKIYILLTKRAKCVIISSDRPYLVWRHEQLPLLSQSLVPCMPLVQIPFACSRKMQPILHEKKKNNLTPIKF